MRDGRGVWGRLLGAVVFVFAVGLAGVPTQEAGATIVVKLDTDGLTTTSDAIVMGRVESLSSSWRGARIVTEVSLRVAMPVMGEVAQGAVVKVEVLGGRVGDLAQRVSGTADFHEGEEVVVFLERPKALSGALRVVGLAQGKYRVVRGPDEGLWAVRDLSGLTLAEVSRTGEGQVARLTEKDAQVLGAVPLASLLREVARGMRKVEVPVRPELLKCLGEDLTKSFDFGEVFMSLPRRGER